MPMGQEGTAEVVLCWHMHQPCYQDLQTGRFLLPWVYLHAIKDYSDMAAHLEAHPQVQAVINFTPILLEQIEEYLSQVQQWRASTGNIGDPILAALVAEKLPEPGTVPFLELMEKCLQANRHRIIQRFPPYAGLATLADYYRGHPESQPYFSSQFIIDLLVWFHLGWMGEAIRRTDVRIQSLQDKGRNYSIDDRRTLLDVIFEALASIGPRYRNLAERKQVELSVSPYAHPILPLLLDFGCAREALSQIPLPVWATYPGGRARVCWQLEQARVVFERFFGLSPEGCWASEGGLSQATLAVLEEQRYRWTATGDSVLDNSVRHGTSRVSKSLPGQIYRLYRFAETAVPVFFRDDDLSDMIGFSYASWDSFAAAADLIRRMEAILDNAAHGGPRVISIVMDGENAWEYYPENGVAFLDEVYRRLEQHPQLRATTFANILSKGSNEIIYLPRMIAGSWIEGTFTTWIGDQDKNRAWEWLCDAKQHYDKAVLSETLTREQKGKATHQLAICEGSDWFWWYGDKNPHQIIATFDVIFRGHLANLYRLIQIPPPAYLSQPLSQRSGSGANGGVMRPGHNSEGSS